MLVNRNQYLYSQLATRAVAFKSLKGAVEGAGVSGSSLHEEILKTAKACASVCPLLLSFSVSFFACL